MINDNLTTDRRFKKSIISLQTLQPFFGFIALNIKLCEVKPEQCKTMGVDANFNLYYNKEWIDNNMDSYDMFNGCVCHEVLHLALNHVGLTGQRLINITNIAQDMAINYIVKNNNMILLEGPEYVNVELSSNLAWCDLKSLGLPKIVVMRISDKSWERIYDEIIEQLEKKGHDPEVVENQLNSMQDGHAFTFDKHMHEAFEKLSKTEQTEIQEKLKQVLAEAYVNSKMIGKIPEGMERHVKDLLEPKIPWQNQLNRYLKSHTEPNDFWYRKPHRKSFALDVYMPSIKKEGIEIEVMVDGSGSIDNESYKEFFSEVYGMMRSLTNVKIYLSVCDTEITDEIILNNTDLKKLLEFKPKTGGGTDLEYGLDQIKEKRRKSEVVIVLTDGETPIYKNRNSYPFDVIWVISKHGMEIEQANKRFKNYDKIIKMW